MAMADRASAVGKTLWLKQAEEAKLKNEAEKAAAAKAAFDATFNAMDKNRENQSSPSSDSDFEDAEDLDKKPIGPVDPARSTAAGAGIAGGAACSPSSFVVVTKDADGRKVPRGGANVKVKISPGVGVGGSDQDGIVKDLGDGTYTVTYIAPKRGNYMVSVECNEKPIMGSPFPVFFSAGTANGGLLGLAPSHSYPNMVNQTMPNMPNYSGSISGSFPGLLGMIPGIVSGASGGAILPGIGASLGEICREYLNGRCGRTDCKLNHPPHNILMTALAASTNLGTLSQVPMAPSAAAMAAAQAIVAAQTLQAHAAQVQAQAQPSRSPSGDALKKTLQVSNLSPLLTVEQLKQLFSFCGTVVGCNIADSKHFAYIEYAKAEEATAALALNNMDVGGRPLNVEMAKSLPQRPPVLNAPLSSSSLPVVMQQAVAMQQLQFQQALLMQQTLTAQQTANRAASMKSATELASARAAEITKKLREGLDPADEKSSRSVSRERSTSPSPLRRSRKSPSPSRRIRDYRYPPYRSHYYSRRQYYYRGGGGYRDCEDGRRHHMVVVDRMMMHHSARHPHRRSPSPSVKKKKKRSHASDSPTRRSRRGDGGDSDDSSGRRRKRSRSSSRHRHRHHRSTSGSRRRESRRRRSQLSSDDNIGDGDVKHHRRRSEKSKHHKRRKASSGHDESLKPSSSHAAADAAAIV